MGGGQQGAFGFAAPEGVKRHRPPHGFSLLGPQRGRGRFHGSLQCSCPAAAPRHQRRQEDPSPAPAWQAKADRRSCAKLQSSQCQPHSRGGRAAGCPAEPYSRLGLGPGPGARTRAGRAGPCAPSGAAVSPPGNSGAAGAAPRGRFIAALTQCPVPHSRGMAQGEDGLAAQWTCSQAAPRGCRGWQHGSCSFCRSQGATGEGPSRPASCLTWL